MTAPIEPIAALRPAPLIERVDVPANEGAGSSFATLIEDASASLHHADDAAALVASGHGNIATAAVARAHADVALEVAAITASRVSGAIATLLQTQV
jgi:hypothetical protein